MASAVDIADFYEFLKKPVNEDKKLVQQTIDAATRAAESRKGPMLIDTFTSRVGSDSGALVLPRTPVVEVISITGVYDPVITWTPADVVVDNALAGTVQARYLPFMRHAALNAQKYDVEYRAGRSATTADFFADFPEYHEAICIIGKHLWDVRMGRSARPGLLGEARGNPDDAENRLPTGFAIPSRARELLGVDVVVS